MFKCWAQTLFLLVVVVLGSGQMLTGCGQKGDLYLPEAGSQTATEEDNKQD